MTARVAARATYMLLVIVGIATDLDLAWEHDGWRLAGCTIALGIVIALRRDLTRLVDCS